LNALRSNRIGRLHLFACSLLPQCKHRIPCGNHARGTCSKDSQEGQRTSVIRLSFFRFGLFAATMDIGNLAS